MIDEGPRVQNRVRIHAACDEVRHELGRVANVRAKREMRKPRQVTARLFERRNVEIGGDERQGTLRQRRSAASPLGHGGVQALEQRSVAASEVGDVGRLPFERQALEIVDDEVFHLPEKGAVLRRRAENVEPSVDVRLVSELVPQKHRRGVAEQQRLHLQEHGPVREHGSELRSAFDEINAGSVQPGPRLIRKAIRPAARGEEPEQFARRFDAIRILAGAERARAAAPLQLDQHRREKRAVEHRRDRMRRPVIGPAEPAAPEPSREGRSIGRQILRQSRKHARKVSRDARDPRLAERGDPIRAVLGHVDPAESVKKPQRDPQIALIGLQPAAQIQSGRGGARQ